MDKEFCDTCGKEISIYGVGYFNPCPDTQEEKPTLNYCSDDCDPYPTKEQLEMRMGTGICDLCGKYWVTRQRGDKRVCYRTVVKDNKAINFSCDSPKE